MSIRRKVGISLCLSMVALGCAALVAPAGAQAGAQTRTTVTSTGDGGYVTTVQYANGDSTSVYSTTPVAISSTIAGPDAGDTTTGDPLGTEVSGTVTPDTSGLPIVDGKATPPGDTITAVDELEALGVAPSDAVSFAGFDSSGPVKDTHGVGPGTTHATPAIGVSASQAYGPPLCTKSYGDGKRVYMYGCDQAYRVYMHGADWYLEDRYQASVVSHDQAIFNPDKVTGVVFGDQYASGNVLYDWSPNETVPKGSCTTTTSTVEVKNYSLSQSSQQCPETFGPYQFGTRIFTSKWDGQGDGPDDEARSVTGASAWHSPPTASPGRSLVWRFWYE